MVFLLNLPTCRSSGEGVGCLSLPREPGCCSPPPGSPSPSRAPELVVRGAGPQHRLWARLGQDGDGAEVAGATPVTQGTSRRGLHHLEGPGYALVGAQTRHYAVVFVGVGENSSQEDEGLNCKLSRADGHPSVGGPVQSAEDLGRTETKGESVPSVSGTPHPLSP